MRISPFLAVPLMLVASCMAQDFHGRLEGTVSDATGGRVRAAEVTLKHATASGERHTKTGALGDFRFDDLDPGNYDLIVTAAGFADARSEVSIVISSVRQVAVSLTLKGNAET